MRYLWIILALLSTAAMGQFADSEAAPLPPYEPKLPSKNAFDYYVAAANAVQGTTPNELNAQPPTEEMITYLQANKKALDLFDTGVKLEFKIPDEYVPILLEPSSNFVNLAKYRKLSRILALRIRWELATEDGMDAVNHCIDGFKFTNQIAEGSIINYLTAFAQSQIISYPIIQNIDFLSAKECRVLMKGIAALDNDTETRKKVLNYEKEIKYSMLDGMERQYLSMDPQQLKDAMAQNEESEDSQPLSEEEKQMMENLIKILSSPEDKQLISNSIKQIKDELDQEYKTCFDKLEKPYCEALEDKPEGKYNGIFMVYYEIARPNFYYKNNSQGKYDLYSFDMAPVFYSKKANRHLLATECALRIYKLRYGKYPASLEEIWNTELMSDPFTGKPLTYRVMGKEYVLYSVGPNGIDNNGITKTYKPTYDSPIGEYGEPVNTVKSDEDDVILQK